MKRESKKKINKSKGITKIVMIDRSVNLDTVLDRAVCSMTIGLAERNATIVDSKVPPINRVTITFMESRGGGVAITKLLRAWNNIIY